jgi:hypothetical protein
MTGVIKRLYSLSITGFQFGSYPAFISVALILMWFNDTAATAENV